MSGKSILRNAIGNIQPGKPLILPKTQTFIPPSHPKIRQGLRHRSKAAGSGVNKLRVT